MLLLHNATLNQHNTMTHAYSFNEFDVINTSMFLTIPFFHHSHQSTRVALLLILLPSFCIFNIHRQVRPRNIQVQEHDNDLEFQGCHRGYSPMILRHKP